MIRPVKGRRRLIDRSTGSVLLAIVVVLVIGGMLFFLYNMRRTSESEGKQFARDVIQHCAFQHDVNFLHSVVAADRRLAVPPAMDQQFIDTLAKLGTPDRNYNVTGDLQFDNYFFSPRGTYKSILTFPDRHGTFFVNVVRPSGIWLVEDYGILWERPPD
jgi:hypothetical protein